MITEFDDKNREKQATVTDTVEKNLILMDRLTKKALIFFTKMKPFIILYLFIEMDNQHWLNDTQNEHSIRLQESSTLISTTPQLLTVP